MNPGEIWHLDDGSLRLVLSNATYNGSRLNRVVTAVVGIPHTEFDPFAIATPLGTVYADRVATHPRHWLADLVGTITDDALQNVRQHVSFLLCQP